MLAAARVGTLAKMYFNNFSHSNFAQFAKLIISSLIFFPTPQD